MVYHMSEYSLIPQLHDTSSFIAPHLPSRRRGTVAVSAPGQKTGSATSCHSAAAPEASERWMWNIPPLEQSEFLSRKGGLEPWYKVVLSFGFLNTSFLGLVKRVFSTACKEVSPEFEFTLRSSSFFLVGPGGRRTTSRPVLDRPSDQAWTRPRLYLGCL